MAASKKYIETSKIFELEERLKLAEARAEDAIFLLYSVYNSKSWKITAPLRILQNFFDGTFQVMNLRPAKNLIKSPSNPMNECMHITAGGHSKRSVQKVYNDIIKRINYLKKKRKSDK
jgi:hypothetical protein